MSSHEFKFDLGDEVKDVITGLQGIITGFSKYLNGCINYCLKSPINDKGEVREGEWVDEPQLELVKSSAIEVGFAGGGPRPDQAPER